MTKPTRIHGWRRLGTIRPTDLVEARLELHWAAQIAAAAGIARAEPAPDWAHHALTWNAEQRGLAGAPVRGRRPCRAGLRLSDGTLFVLDGKDALLESFALAGHTIHEGLAWLDAAIQRYTGESAASLALPEHELPEHAFGKGAPFGAGAPAARAELESWFANLDGLLRAANQAPVRCWPHHFDLDTLIPLPEKNGAEQKIGLGMSPGDESYAEPYLYALPTPYPEVSALPALAPPFEWITEGWVGAVLTGSKLATGSADAQAALAERFFREAERDLRAALGN